MLEKLLTEIEEKGAGNLLVSHIAWAMVPKYLSHGRTRLSGVRLPQPIMEVEVAAHNRGWTCVQLGGGRRLWHPS